MNVFGGLRWVTGLAYRDSAVADVNADAGADNSPVAGRLPGSGDGSKDAAAGAADVKPTLVLVHGGAGSRSHWLRNIDALAARFRVLSVDLPGYGESARPPSSMGTADYVDWFGASLTTLLGTAPFHLAAFSFGAVTACAALARGALTPRALTLIGPGGFGPPRGEAVPLQPVPRRDEATDAEIRAVVAANLGAWMLAETPAADDPAVTLHLRNIARTRFDSRAISLGQSLLTDLARLPVPLQVIWGERDSLAYPSVAIRAAELRAVRPDARITLIPGAGHWTQYDAADDVNRALTAFHE